MSGRKPLDFDEPLARDSPEGFTSAASEDEDIRNMLNRMPLAAGAPEVEDFDLPADVPAPVVRRAADFYARALAADPVAAPGLDVRVNYGGGAGGAGGGRGYDPLRRGNPRDNDLLFARVVAAVGARDAVRMLRRNDINAFDYNLVDRLGRANDTRGLLRAIALRNAHRARTESEMRPIVLANDAFRHAAHNYLATTRWAIRARNRESFEARAIQVERDPLDVGLPAGYDPDGFFAEAQPQQNPLVEDVLSGGAGLELDQAAAGAAQMALTQAANAGGAVAIAPPPPRVPRTQDDFDVPATRGTPLPGVRIVRVLGARLVRAIDTPRGRGYATIDRLVARLANVAGGLSANIRNAGGLAPQLYAFRLTFNMPGQDDPVYIQTGGFPTWETAIRAVIDILLRRENSIGADVDLTTVTTVEAIAIRAGGVFPAAPAAVGAGVTRIQYKGLLAGQGDLRRAPVVGREAKDGWGWVTDLASWVREGQGVIPIPTQIDPMEGCEAEDALLRDSGNLCFFMALAIAPVFTCAEKTGVQNGVRTVEDRPMTKGRIEKEYLSREAGYGRGWLLQACQLRDYYGMEPGKKVELPDGVQAIADKSRTFIHIIERKACNQVTYSFVPKGYLSTAEKFELPSSHIYLYMVEDHVHVVTKPTQLLRGGRETTAPYLCHFCHYTTYDDRVLVRHMRGCPIFSGEDESPTQGDRSFKNYLARFDKPDFRPTGGGEPNMGHFCQECGEYRAKKATRPNFRGPKRGNSTLFDVNDVNPGDWRLLELVDPGARRREIDAMMQEVKAGDFGEEGELCISLGHTLEYRTLEVCVHCHQMSPVGFRAQHRCYCRRPKSMPTIADDKLYFFDFEAVEEDEHRGHRIVFGHLMTSNGEECWDFNDLDSFCRFVFDDRRFRGATLIAHNSSRYDGQFILGWLLKNGAQPSFNKLSGLSSKTLQIEWTGRRFIDSCCFMPFALANFGKTFKLNQGKGHFPHAFCTMERWEADYEGPMPDIEFYNVKGVRASDPQSTREAVRELQQWHAQEVVKYEPHTALKWSIRRVMREYCRLDVEVLRQGCLIFRRELLSAQGFVEAKGSRPSWTMTPCDPFAWMTQAQLALNLFLAGLQRRFRIAHFPYRAEYREGDGVWTWLAYIEAESKQHVIHRGNYFDRSRFELPDGIGRVQGWQTRMFDGAPKEVALVFFDCADNGCLNCMPDRQARHPRFNKTYYDLYEGARERMAKLCQRLGGEQFVEFTWAHTWRQLCNDMEAAGQDSTLDELKVAGMPIAESGFFFGGRVDAFASRVVAGPGQKICHVDVTSMYPWACAHCPLPHGHPTAIAEADVDRGRLVEGSPNAYFGIVKCHVTPPHNIVIPTLPCRRAGTPDEDLDDAIGEGERLKFTGNAQVGSWTTVELHHAVRQGYVIGRVYEVHHFEETEVTTGLFSGYVDYWLRIKIEAEGWPSENMSDAEKKAYCDDLEEQNGGIGRPREDCVAKNPGKRALSKLMLNSLWGKFAQKPRTSEHAYVTTPGRFDDLIMSPYTDKTTMRFMEYAPDALLATFSLVSNFKQSPTRSNCYLAAFVTAHARVRLHGLMERAGYRSVIYCDTDSVMFVQGVDEDRLPCTPGLGNLTNELDEGVEITEILITGPKSYCKIFSDGTYDMKSKGITLNAGNLDRLTPDVMRKGILDVYHGIVAQGAGICDLTQFTIRSAMQHGTVSVFSQDTDKIISVGHSKRWMVTRMHTGLPEDYDPPVILTVPHGLNRGVIERLDFSVMSSHDYYNYGRERASEYPTRELAV